MTGWELSAGLEGVRVAEVTVFVDDAVLGRLPPVCARDGVEATCRMRFTEEVGRSSRLGIMWILLLLGPVGWIAFLLLAPGDRGEQLTVRIPYGDAADNRLAAAERLRNRALLFGALTVTALIVLTLWVGLGGAGWLLVLAATVAAVVAAAVGAFRFWGESVGISLDASRRWVTLKPVHPAFRDACRADLEQRRAGTDYDTDQS